MKVFIESYGCTFNQADGQIIAGNLQANNIEIVDSIEEADVVILCVGEQAYAEWLGDSIDMELCGKYGLGNNR